MSGNYSARGDARKNLMDGPVEIEPLFPSADTITIPKPQIFTGPKHQTVDEATADYLRHAAVRVRSQQIWGSGVSALVADLLDSVADEIQPEAPTGDES